MKPSEFDFSRFKDWLAPREMRMRQFLSGEGESNLHLIEKEWEDFLICRTPQESLQVQLDAITRQMEACSDYVPFLEPWFGVGVFANAFGAEYVWVDGESAQTRYTIFNEDQAARTEIPDIDASPVMRLVMQAIDYFLNETRGEIPISCTDTQSPLDTITLLWDTASFFTATYTAPDIVHGLLQKITDVMVAYTRRQVACLGDAWVRPGHIMVSARRGPGLSISDDNIVMVSPDHYRDFAVPYNSQLSQAFGGLAVHSCGNYIRQLSELLKTPGLVMVDGPFSKEMDPDPIRDMERYRDLILESGVILHARMGTDWPEVLPHLYHPDLRLALTVPVPQAGEPQDKNRILLDRFLQQFAGVKS